MGCAPDPWRTADAWVRSRSVDGGRLCTLATGSYITQSSVTERPVALPPAMARREGRGRPKVEVAHLRADQSANRQDMGLITADASKNLLKLSPLFDWTRDKVTDFAAAHGVPINSLDEKGFVSIGCASCARTILPGEPERAGRWWWEDEAKKECGIHVSRSS